MIAQPLRIFFLIALALFALAVATLSSQTPLQRGLDPQKSIGQYVHEAWQIKEGLPQNSVQSITQTPDGYIWFTTQEGLVRFDGLRFTAFNKANSALPENYCNSIVTDYAGAVWTATQTQGVVRLQNGRFTVFNARQGLSSSFMPENARGLAASRDGSLWIATLGGGVNRLKDGKITVYSTRQGLSADDVHTLFMSGDDTLWIGTAKGLDVLNARTGDLRHIPLPSARERRGAIADNAVQAIIQDRRGAMWVGTINGLHEFYAGRWKTYTVADGLPSAHIRTLFCDSRGTLWIGCLGAGVSRFRDGVFSSFTGQDGLTHPDIYHIFEDAEGSLYIGTGGGGLNRLRNASVTVFSRRVGLADPWSIMEDREGNMWFSTFANGVSVVQRGTNAIVKRYTTKNGLPSDNSHSMMQDADGSVWLGTRDNGMCRIARGAVAQRYGVGDGLPNGRVRAFLRDRRGRLWIGTDKGATLFANGVFTHFGKAAGLSDGRTPVLHEDKQGRIWIGTREGLFVLENDRVQRAYTVKSGMAGDNIIYLYEDKEGVFWIGTTNGGLHRLSNDSLFAYTTRNGLFDDSVFSIVEDDNGWLWMSCSKGIFRAKKSELHEAARGARSSISCVVYGASDGMASPECNGAAQPAVWKAADGRLWFPTIAGAVVVDPNDIVKNTLPPAVIIETVIADERRIGGQNPYLPSDDATNDKERGKIQSSAHSSNATDVLTLSATAEKFEFHYTATCLTAANKVRFKYILEGYDKNWVDAAARRAAYYTNLPRDRRYRFRVIACNNDGVWNETGASVQFYLEPFWYETWKFYVVCAVGLFGAAFALYRWRVHRFRAKALALESLVRERTADLKQANEEIQRQMDLLSERAREIEFTNAQLHEANNNLHRSNAALDEAHQFKTQMLSMVSHDLKNPITTILLAANSLRRQMNDNALELETIDMIRESAETMHTLIIEILDQAALQAGKLSINSEKFPLEDLCLELIHEYRYRAKDKRQEIRAEIEDGCFISGDKKRLRQVIDNLISNAVKYSPSGSHIVVRLRKDERADNSVVRFEVQDEGPGLAEADKQKLFGFFQRLSAQPTGGENSTGVGLAIVKQIIELHGGRIWCESELGKGATFIVELPIQAQFGSATQ